MRTLILLCLTVPMAAFGWGRTGHQVVCQIAYEEMKDATRATVDRLMDMDPDFQSFAESCLFADGPPRIRAIEHYINLPRSFQAVGTTECPMAESCLFTAIENESNILSDARRSDRHKLRALKLLGHWVGDIHQPLHVSYQDDLGGNLIAKQDTEQGGNIHSVWDYDIIEHGIGKHVAPVANMLRAEISDSERTLWKYASPVEWANESYQITISAQTEYCVPQYGACWYAPDNMILGKGEPRREVGASEQYLSANRDIVAQRLKQAGVRLAARLDDVLQ